MDKTNALELYKAFRQENSTWLSSHREHSQQFITLIVAILGASIASAVQLATNPNLLPSSLPSKSLLVAPFEYPMLSAILLISICLFINTLFCWIAISLCNRSYQAYLECLTIQAKLEPIIGLTAQRQTNSLSGTSATSSPGTAVTEVIVYPADQTFVPQRWLDGRSKFISAKQFVESNMNKGANQRVRLAFIVLGFFNVVVGVSLALFAFAKGGIL
jgi:hypothetical protein